MIYKNFLILYNIILCNIVYSMRKVIYFENNNPPPVRRDGGGNRLKRIYINNEITIYRLDKNKKHKCKIIKFRPP